MSLKKYNDFIYPQSMKIMVGDNFLNLEVCTDHEKGLAKRDYVEYDGMIFIYPDPIPLSFHMKDCKFPLDIIFCNEAQVVKIHENCPPCESDPCKKYSCDLGDLVIELPAGKCSELSINEGDLCQIV